MRLSVSKLIVLIVVLLFFGMSFCFWLINGSDFKPKRINNIPNSASWIGGIDEGFWFDIIEIDVKEETYRFKIYNDYEGVLVMDSKFIKDSTCNNEYPLNKSILKKISHFEFDKIQMIGNCKLLMIKPAYGGVFWELDKEIQK